MEVSSGTDELVDMLEKAEEQCENVAFAITSGHTDALWCVDQMQKLSKDIKELRNKYDVALDALITGEM